ncbi:MULTISPECIES: RHS repeat domain-containing protein [unclassified Treponema]|uniref:RHS repeat domain-containing protein n=1 Tax=unclassified Treponema TaxID=2638727 RepID=UPI0020A45E09|nr:MULTISPECIES: RHS repeat-associated core domain-containing protein [unclassified Treponema]
MKISYLFNQPNHINTRTAIVREQKQFIKIAFAVHLSAAISAERYRSDSGALKSAVPHFVFFMIIINKMQQSAKRKLLLNKNNLSEVFPLTVESGKTMAFENRWSRYKEPSKNKAEAYLVYVEHLFLRSDAGDARIFSKDDEHAQRVYIRYGNGVETRYKYDEKRRWLDSIETKNNQTQDVFQKIKYSFDPVGNVLGYNNDASTYETNQSYTYDNLYQLIGVEGTSNQYKAKKSSGTTPVSIAKYKQTFAFDGIGNMKEKLSTTNIPGSQGNSYPKAELDYSLDYEYDPAYAHRLIRAGTRYYRYDANGNITAEKDGPFTDEEEFVFTYSYFEEQDVYGADYGFGLDAPKETEQSNPQDLFAYRRNYTWNERNLLTKSSDRNFTVHYRYGEDGQRALKYTDEGRSETLYFNNFFTIHIPTQDQNNPQGLRVHKHIFVGNSRLVTAMTHTDNQGDNEEQKVKRYYYHSDHLGSAQFVTDWKGKQYEHIEYTPYGELWVEEVAAGLDKLPFRFTGKELDEETGLYYYGARYLDPKYSRWLSGDPAVSDYIPKAPIDDEAKKHNENLPGLGGVYNTVNLHVYHYAGNNPVKYTDPDGRDIHILTLGGVGAKLVIGGSLNIGIAWDDNGNSALVMTGGFGVGVEAQLHTFLTPSYSVTKGKNIDDLPGIGSTRISFNASLTGTEANVGVGIGINFDMESNEISGINAGIIGGGVNFIGFARFKIIKHGEKSRSAEQLKEIIDTIKNLDSIPDDIKQQILKTIKEMM